MAPNQFVFNHVPKTGGISLLTVCRENLPPESISPHLVDLEIRYRTPAQFEHYPFINGHFSLLTQIGFCRNRYSIVLLRHPIKRIVSTYCFYRIATEGGLLRRQARELSFADFVDYFQESPTVLYESYCHHFAAIAPDFTEYPTDREGLLDTAKHNLAAFDFVGISEEFERSVGLLCQELEWQKPDTMPHENRSFSESRTGEIDRQTWETLEERCQLDLKLYEFARQLFLAHESGQSATANGQVSGDAERNRFVPLAPPLAIRRKAQIEWVRTAWVQSVSSPNLELSVAFRCTEETEDLSLGIAITDSAGKIVWGANTADNNIDLAAASESISTVKFLLQCHLPAGSYTITVALASQRRLGFHEHWIDHAAQFSVASRQASSLRGVHTVRLLHAETGFSNRSSWLPGWSRYPAPAGPQTEDLGLASTESTASIRVLPRQSEQFAPQAFLEIDRKLSNPRVRIELPGEPIEWLFDSRNTISVRVTNLGDEPLSSRYTFPVKLSYHWMSDSGKVKQHDGLRTNLLSDILPGESSIHQVVIGAPPAPSCTLLCITLVQEYVCWFDDHSIENRLILRLDKAEAMSA